MYVCVFARYVIKSCKPRSAGVENSSYAYVANNKNLHYLIIKNYYFNILYTKMIGKIILATVILMNKVVKWYTKYCTSNFVSIFIKF